MVIWPEHLTHAVSIWLSRGEKESLFVCLFYFPIHSFGVGIPSSSVFLCLSNYKTHNFR